MKSSHHNFVTSPIHLLQSTTRPPLPSIPGTLYALHIPQDCACLVSTAQRSSQRHRGPGGGGPRYTTSLSIYRSSSYSYPPSLLDGGASMYLRSSMTGGGSTFCSRSSCFTLLCLPLMSSDSRTSCWTSSCCFTSAVFHVGWARQ